MKTAGRGCRTAVVCLRFRSRNGVTRESEGRSWLPLLRPVRQSMDASRRKMIPLVSTALDARIYPACFRHKTRRSKGGNYLLPHLYKTFGLVRLTRLGRDVPWAKAEGLVREPDARKSACPVR
jgi:hypothetical protein